MYGDELMERSPMRVVGSSIRGGIRAGQVGLVLAPPGGGKSAFLVQVGLSHALRGSPVLHVSLRDSQARLQGLYEELFAALLREVAPEHRERARLDLERNRLLHASRGRPFGPEQLRELLDTAARVMDFQPAVAILDGLPPAEAEPGRWRGLAAQAVVRIWISVDTEASAEGPSNFAETADTTVVLEGEEADLRLLVRRPGSPELWPAQRLDPFTLLLRQAELELAEARPPSPHPRACTLYSGGALGAESAFGEEAERWGVAEVNFSFEGHHPARDRGRRLLSDRELSAGDVSLLYVAHRLNRSWERTELLRKVLQSQWHVVTHAAQIFAVGVIQSDGTVHGGTGWAVELGRRWGRQVWVYCQERDGWSEWCGGQWRPGLPLIQSPRFAGTGTRFLSDRGREAIDALFRRSFSG